MHQWYYTSGGQQQGPVSTEQLQSWIASGQLADTELVWREGMAQWVPIHQSPEFQSQGPGYEVGGGQYASVTGTQYGGNQYASGQTLGYAQPLQYHNPTFGQQLVYAGFWWRFLAAFVDGIILNIAGLIVGFVFGFAAGAAGGDIEVIELGGNVIGIILGWLYSALMESSTHQATLGKMMCGITVTDLNGQRINFGRATGRHFAKILSALILLIGYIMQPFTERKQALHDMMAGCLVLKKP